MKIYLSNIQILKDWAVWTNEYHGKLTKALRNQRLSLFLEIDHISTASWNNALLLFLFRQVIYENNRNPHPTQDRCLALQQALNLAIQISLLGAFAPIIPYASLLLYWIIEVLIIKDATLLRPVQKEHQRWENGEFQFLSGLMPKNNKTLKKQVNKSELSQ